MCVVLSLTYLINKLPEENIKKKLMYATFYTSYNWFKYIIEIIKINNFLNKEFVFAVFVSRTCTYTLSMVSITSPDSTTESPFNSLYFSMHERNPPLQNAPSEDGHTASMELSSSSITSHLCLYSTDWISRILRPYPRISSCSPTFSLVARHSARLFIQHRGAKYVAWYNSAFLVVSLLTCFTASRCRSPRCRSKRTGKREKFAPYVTRHSEDRSQTPAMARIPLPESLFPSLFPLFD